MVECALPEELKLNKLAIFTFSIGTVNLDALVNQTIMSSWAAAVQRVKTIRFNCDDDEESAFVNILLKYEQPFPNLVEFITTSTRDNVLDFLLKLTTPLKKLKLCNLQCLERRGNYAKFEKLLRKHAATLESLQFMYDIDDKNVEGRTIHLPIFPQLKMLFVGWMEFSNLKIRFPSGIDNGDVLDYERHLPRLQALSLSLFPSSFPSTRDWENQRDRLDIFFPTVDRNGAPIETRCVTLRELSQNIYVSYMPGFCCVSDFPSDLPLTRMFPNVWNDWMTKRRREELASASSQLVENIDKVD
ncbi:hypothetical protein Fcan01_11011 [Folsomia candida]|uniref:Uncharacterized protein n=2 Tax=Folsomia candida TaxID=158441 RepID=A0A226E8Z7_FOLCA|nr:hypothetical protein Fcan01_11011 [Folsomia candida]